MAASLSDSNVLGANAPFVSRVQSSLLAACINIFAENAATVVNHRERVAFIHQTLSTPTQLTAITTMVALSVATDTTVLGLATQAGTVVLTTGNVATQQALVTDTSINTAIAGQFNAFVPGIPS